jgi:hypothetical protein
MTTEKKLAIAGIIALCGIVVFAIWSHGTTRNINGDPVYGKLVEKKYETKIDLYLTQSQQSGKCFIKVPGEYLPEIKDIKSFPDVSYHRIIHKVIPSRAVFTITNVVLANKPFRGSDIWIKAKFEDEKIYKDEVDVTFISDFNSNNAKMNPEYVTEITPEGAPIDAK